MMFAAESWNSAENVRHLWVKTDQMAEGFFGLIPNLVIAVVLLVAAIFTARLIQSLIIRWTDENDNAHVGIVVGRLAKWALVFLGFLVAVSIVAPSVGAAQIFGMLGIGSVAIGFAFKDVLQNFLAGILILLHKPFRVGDSVKIAGYSGTVEEIETRSTILKTFDGQKVYIPNGTVFTSPVEVTTAYPYRRHDLSLAIAHSENISEKMSQILDAMRSVKGVLREPAPAVNVEDLDANTVKLKAFWWAKNQDFGHVGSEVITAIKQRLEDPNDDAQAASQNDHKNRVPSQST